MKAVMAARLDNAGSGAPIGDDAIQAIASVATRSNADPSGLAAPFAMYLIIEQNGD